MLLRRRKLTVVAAAVVSFLTAWCVGTVLARHVDPPSSISCSVNGSNGKAGPDGVEIRFKNWSHLGETHERVAATFNLGQRRAASHAETVRLPIVIRNDGDHVLEVETIAKSCGCLSIPSPPPIEPGGVQRTEVKLVVAVRGRVEHAVDFVMTDGRSVRIVLSIDVLQEPMLIASDAHQVRMEGAEARACVRRLLLAALQGNVEPANARILDGNRDVTTRWTGWRPRGRSKDGIALWIGEVDYDPASVSTGSDLTIESGGVSIAIGNVKAGV